MVIPFPQQLPQPSDIDGDRRASSLVSTLGPTKVLYVIVVLLSFVGICCATIWMRMATLKAWFPPGPQR